MPEHGPAFGEALWRETIDSISDGVLIADREGRILFYNAAWVDLSLGSLAQQYPPLQNVYEFPDYAPTVKKPVALEVLRTQKPCVNVFQTPNKRVILSKGRPVFASDGGLQYVVILVRDISSVLSLRERGGSEVQKLYAEYLRQAGVHAADRPVVINPKMAAIYEKCMTISGVDATVLIQGESGTGKEVLAQFIHKNSPRKDRPFLSLNCGAIPETLLESELFGYEPNAFTGASRTGKKGIFEAANTGTLLLDEMGELPKDMQVKLLRVLETRRVTRVGATESIPFDVRIIVATNRNLAQRVKLEQFRSDLYYRINIISITIPPLRERPEDIIALSNHFLDRFNAQYHRTRALSYDAYQMLTKYGWPGNVRELRNVLEQLVILSPADDINGALLRDILEVTSPEETVGCPVTVNRPARLQRVVEEAERQAITLALRTNKTTRTLAQALGVSQTTVVRKLNQYGLRATDD